MFLNVVFNLIIESLTFKKESVIFYFHQASYFFSELRGIKALFQGLLGLLDVWYV